MTNNYSSHRRKMRQLKSLSKRLKQSLSTVSAAGELEMLISKIKRLVNELRNVFAAWQLKKVLGTACLFLGISFTNTSTAQNFGAVQQNTFGLTAVNYNSSPALVDLDNDGDLDLMVGDFYSSFSYFQNTGTASAPSFTTALTNPFGITATPAYFAAPAFADLDNDGDQDMMSGVYGGNFLYYENTGTATVPSFTAALTNPFGLAATYQVGFPAFGDLDNDGDKDLIAGEVGGDFIYFQNTGTATAPSYTTPVTNPYGLTSLITGTASISAAEFTDMDGDGDLDLLTTDATGALQYFQNTGSVTSPTFAAVVTNPFSLTAVTGYAMMSFGDLDNDGDKDLMVGDYNGNLNYFERLNPTGIKSQEQASATSLSIYPNPAVDMIEVKGSWAEYVVGIEIMDVSGKVCASYKGKNKAVSVKDLAAGVYTVKITHENGSFEVKKLQKN